MNIGAQYHDYHVVRTAVHCIGEHQRLTKQKDYVNALFWSWLWSMCVLNPYTKAFREEKQSDN
jgi:hypothetical protein